MKIVKYHVLSFLLLGLITTSCGDEVDPIDNSDRFDRSEMLKDWADLIIIPAFRSYVSLLEVLESKRDNFESDANLESLEKLRIAYLDAYKAWQRVSMFDIGKAEAIGLRNFSNIFPTDIEAIEVNIQNQDYNLALPSNFDVQGFPALDYLLFGIAENDQEIMMSLIEAKQSNYINDLVDRLLSLGKEVLDDWEVGGFRESFIQNNGASGTASVDKLVNDFLFYYEKYLRAGKIGIPAGKFSGNALPMSVEVPYSKVYSKELFLVAFNATKDFFNGKSFDGLQQGISLKSYLDYVMTQNQTADIATGINDQWSLATNAAMQLSESFKDQIEENNSFMLKTFDELQTAVILLKVDMMQALNIQVDYIDADGD